MLVWTPSGHPVTQGRGKGDPYQGPRSWAEAKRKKTPLRESAWGGKMEVDILIWLQGGGPSGWKTCLNWLWTWKKPLNSLKRRMHRSHAGRSCIWEHHKALSGRVEGVVSESGVNVVDMIPTSDLIDWKKFRDAILQMLNHSLKAHSPLMSTVGDRVWPRLPSPPNWTMNLGGLYEVAMACYEVSGADCGSCYSRTLYGNSAIQTQ